MQVATTNREPLERLFREHGFEDFRWLRAADIVVAHWVRMKCQYGCPEYGTNVACPPNNPSVAECERFIREYAEAAIFRFVKAAPDEEERKRWSRPLNAELLALERAVFLSGHRKAFMLLMGSCPHCEECVGRPGDCRLPGSARPTPEGLAVDLFSTAHAVGYPLDVLTDPSQPMNRYAILLVE
jgi:predicted metal-binding protein